MQATSQALTDGGADDPTTHTRRATRRATHLLLAPTHGQDALVDFDGDVLGIHARRITADLEFLHGASEYARGQQEYVRGRRRLPEAVNWCRAGPQHGGTPRCTRCTKHPPPVYVQLLSQQHTLSPSMMSMGCMAMGDAARVPLAASGMSPKVPIKRFMALNRGSSPTPMPRNGVSAIERACLRNCLLCCGCVTLDTCRDCWDRLFDCCKVTLSVFILSICRVGVAAGIYSAQPKLPDESVGQEIHVHAGTTKWRRLR